MCSSSGNYRYLCQCCSCLSPPPVPYLFLSVSIERHYYKFITSASLRFQIYILNESPVSEGIRSLMICSNKLVQELKFITEIFYDLGYPLDIMQPSLSAKIAQFHRLKHFGPEKKYPVYLSLL